MFLYCCQYIIKCYLNLEIISPLLYVQLNGLYNVFRWRLSRHHKTILISISFLGGDANICIMYIHFIDSSWGELKWTFFEILLLPKNIIFLNIKNLNICMQIFFTCIGCDVCSLKSVFYFWYPKQFVKNAARSACSPLSCSSPPSSGW